MGRCCFCATLWLAFLSMILVGAESFHWPFSRRSPDLQDLKAPPEHSTLLSLQATAGVDKTASISSLKASAAEDACIQSVFADLVKRCKDLSLDGRRRIAVKLANCHFAKSGLKTFRCEAHMSIEECTKRMGSDGYSFNTYTTFLTHTDNVCYDLLSHDFAEQTSSAISRMQHSLTDASEQLHHHTQRLQADLSLAQSSISDVSGAVASMGSRMQEQLSQAHDSLGALHATSQATHDTSVRSLDLLRSVGEVQEQLRGTTSDVAASMADVRSSAIDSSAKLDAALVAQAKLMLAQQEARATLDELNAQQETLRGALERSAAQQVEVMRVQEQMHQRDVALHRHTHQLVSSVEEHARAMGSQVRHALDNSRLILHHQHQARIALSTLQDEQRTGFDAAASSLTELRAQAVAVTTLLSNANAVITASLTEVHTAVEGVRSHYHTFFGHFVRLEALLTYGAASVLALALTCAAPTRPARFFLFTVLGLSFVCENVASRLLPPDAPHALYTIVHMCRKGTLWVWGVSLVWRWYHYRDPARVALDMLQRLHHNTLQIQRYLDSHTLRPPSRPSSHITDSDTASSTDTFSSDVVPLRGLPACSVLALPTRTAPPASLSLPPSYPPSLVTGFCGSWGSGHDGAYLEEYGGRDVGVEDDALDPDYIPSNPPRLLQRHRDPYMLRNLPERNPLRMCINPMVYFESPLDFWMKLRLSRRLTCRSPPCHPRPPHHPPPHHSNAPAERDVASAP